MLQIFLVLWVWYFALTMFALIRFFYRMMQVRRMQDETIK